MVTRNIDFFAVSFITLVMLGISWVRSWHWNEALDSIRVQNAIHMENCPIQPEVLSNLAGLLHR